MADDRHKDKARGVRIPDGRWQAVKDKAERDGKTANEVVNDAIEKELRRDARKRGK